MKIQNFDTKKNIFLIAEIGNNHEGDFVLAKKLIFLAKKNGADAVKFQFITPEKLINPKNNKKRIQHLDKFCLHGVKFNFKKILQKIKIILCSIFDFDVLKNKNYFQL